MHYYLYAITICIIFIDTLFLLKVHIIIILLPKVPLYVISEWEEIRGSIIIITIITTEIIIIPVINISIIICIIKFPCVNIYYCDHHIIFIWGLCDPWESKSLLLLLFVTVLSIVYVEWDQIRLRLIGTFFTDRCDCIGERRRQRWRGSRDTDHCFERGCCLRYVLRRTPSFLWSLPVWLLWQRWTKPSRIGGNQS